MSDAKQSDYLIIHATDLKPDGQETFKHAVSLARDMKAKLVTLHVTEGKAVAEAPKAREVLKGFTGSDVKIDHDVVIKEQRKTPKKDLLEAARALNPALVVIGTRQQQGGDKKSFRSSVSEVAALDIEGPTLVTHVGQKGLVDDDGNLTIKRVLVPIGDGAEARDTIQGLTGFLDRLGIDDVDLFLLRVGDDDVLDTLTVPKREGWRWHREVKKQGFVANTVAEVCEAKDIDMIAMATRGQDGFVDVFSGTHTQKVIRRAPRPVLAIAARDEVETDDLLT